jgi:hypothetical protein
MTAEIRHRVSQIRFCDGSGVAIQAVLLGFFEVKQSFTSSGRMGTMTIVAAVVHH